MDLLIVFAKYPEAGNVKTRLAKAMGHQKAAKFYRELFEQLIRNTDDNGFGYKRTLYFDPPSRESEFRQWFPQLSLKPQSGTSLGQRLTQACREAFSEGAQRIIIIGSDCPEIYVENIREALTHLNRFDLLIGPARDGGYYLIGMKRFYPELFQDIAWSTPAVCEQTLSQAHKLRLKTFLLPLRSDIDTYQDYLEWQKGA
jgi:rSAM/selenodomain-associated transferase 1